MDVIRTATKKVKRLAGRLLQVKGCEKTAVGHGSEMGGKG
jgi:hypothetical protein